MPHPPKTSVKNDLMMHGLALPRYSGDLVELAKQYVQPMYHHNVESGTSWGTQVLPATSSYSYNQIYPVAPAIEDIFQSYDARMPQVSQWSHSFPAFVDNRLPMPPSSSALLQNGTVLSERPISRDELAQTGNFLESPQEEVITRGTPFPTPKILVRADPLAQSTSAFQVPSSPVDVPLSPAISTRIISSPVFAKSIAPAPVGVLPSRVLASSGLVASTRVIASPMLGRRALYDEPILASRRRVPSPLIERRMLHDEPIGTRRYITTF